MEKQNAVIWQYLIEEEMQKPEVATVLLEKISKYDDIKQDFCRWLKERNYDASGLNEMGYSPKDISKMAPFLHGIGVYNFMVTLRDDPVFAKEAIASGFRVE